MKKLFIYSTLFLSLLISGCAKIQYDDISFVQTATDPTKLEAMFDITQDNSGLVTIYPNGEGLANFSVFFGDGTVNPEKVSPGGSVKHTYKEGIYDVKIVGTSITGKTTEAIQKLTVSFRAPENLEVTTAVDPSSAFKINVTAKALYETLFRIYWGEDPSEVPVSFLEGQTISHTYAKSGKYTIRVVALSGGVATTTFTKDITIEVPINLPLDFETVGQTYPWINFDGGNVTVVDNPSKSGINQSAKVGKMVKNAGQIWGGSLLRLSSPIDFSVNKVMKMKVWSPRAGANVLLKVENSENASISFEKEVATTVANAWEELTFDYRSINNAESYNNIVLIFDLGTVGDGSSNFTFYFDDLRQTSSLTDLALPLSFESASVNYNFTDFDGGAVTVVDNPSKTGINGSAKVGKMVKNSGQPWGGSLITLPAPIDFSSNKFMKMKVYSPRSGATVLLKVENATDANISFQKEVFTTVANGWEELTFDFNAINTGNTYQKIVLIFELGTVGDGSSNFTFYFDDITTASTGEEVHVPLTFESSVLTYDFTNFDGGNASIVDNPNKSGINTSSKVGKMVKGPGGQFWGGSFIELAKPIDLSSSKSFKVKVHVPRAGAKLLLKVENLSNNALNFEKEATTTKANEWEELTFDYSAINMANTYQRVVLIFDFGDVGDGSSNFTYYFDDIIIK